MSRRADQGPKTIEQIHKEAKIEEQEEQRKVQQLMTKEKRRPGKEIRFGGAEPPSPTCLEARLPGPIWKGDFPAEPAPAAHVSAAEPPRSPRRAAFQLLGVVGWWRAAPRIELKLPDTHTHPTDRAKFLHKTLFDSCRCPEGGRGRLEHRAGGKK